MTMQALLATVMVVLCRLRLVYSAEWPDCSGHAATDPRPCWSVCKGGVHTGWCPTGRSADEYGGDSVKNCCKKSTVLGCKTTKKLCLKAGWLEWYEKGNEFGGTPGCTNNACSGTTSAWEINKYCGMESASYPPPACPAEYTTTAAANVFCPHGHGVVSPSGGYEYKNICKAKSKFKANRIGVDTFQAAAHRSAYGDAYDVDMEMDEYDETEQELLRDIEIDRLKLRLDRAKLREDRLRRQHS